MRLFVLRLNGAPAAAFYGFTYDGTCSFLQRGFDPQFHRPSVGQVLLSLSIERAIDEGAREYDFLSGNDGYKDLWVKTSRPLINVTACPPGASLALNRVAEAAQRARRNLMTVVKAWRTSAARPARDE